MRQISYSLRAIAVILAMGLGGCGLFGGGQQEELDPGTEPIPLDEQPVEIDPQATSPDGTEEEEFPDPTVEGETTRVGSLPGDLIPSTDPEARATGVERQRSDPFDLLPTAPTVEIPVEEPRRPSRNSNNNNNNNNNNNSGSSSGNGSGSNTGAQPSGPGSLAPIPDLVPITPPVPPPPQPELARAVAVSGVVQLGNVPYAIVTAPNESHTRYVRAGQRLSNGEVLVKRIEMIPGVDPVVVFEQFGIEVSTAVGSGGAPATADSDETAAVVVANRE
ncbi:MAG: hypothetical protein WBA57_20450 [Elainellaceae cyanobacterium]